MEDYPFEERTKHGRQYQVELAVQDSVRDISSFVPRVQTMKRNGN